MTDHLKIFNALEFKPVTKKPIVYTALGNSAEIHFSDLPAYSFAIAQGSFDVITQTADGEETRNRANHGDVIVSGPSREKYVLSPAKFEKMYIREGNHAHPEQTPRLVARYMGAEEFEFPAPWGTMMVIKPGDYVVKEGPDTFYRIAQHEYEQTYTQE